MVPQALASVQVLVLVRLCVPLSGHVSHALQEDHSPQPQFSTQAWQFWDSVTGGLELVVSQPAASMQFRLRFWLPLVQEPHAPHSPQDQFSWQARALTMI